MKKIILALGLLFLVLSNGIAQSSLEKEVQKLFESNGYTLSTSQFANISEGTTAYNFKTFYAGNDYVIVAFPDEDGVSDVDLFLYDDDGSLYDKSETSDNTEVIKFSPLTTREMKIVIKNYDSDDSYNEYRCMFMVFYK